MKDPRYREAYRETRSVQLGKFRRDAIRLLGLTAKEADAVIGLMVDRQMRDIAEPTPYVNVTPDGLQQLKEQTENRERTYQDEIRARIGEDKRARWQTYLDSLGSRRLVEMLRAQLPDTDALRDDQVEPLISALHVEAAQYEREFAELNETVLSESDTADQMRRYQEHKMALMTANNHRQHVAASAILSTAQLRLLDEALQRELDREQADQRAALIADKLDKQASPPGQ